MATGWEGYGSIELWLRTGSGTVVSSHGMGRVLSGGRQVSSHGVGRVWLGSVRARRRVRSDREYGRAWELGRYMAMPSLCIPPYLARRRRRTVWLWRGTIWTSTPYPYHILNLFATSSHPDTTPYTPPAAPRLAVAEDALALFWCEVNQTPIHTAFTLHSHGFHDLLRPR